jgi:ADP-ribose pyrophosphatase YjhB (NUDIX family)
MRESVRAIVVHNDKMLVMRRFKDGREFYALVGGGIDAGESAEQALHREVAEEASLEIINPRLVINQIGGDKFGRQYIYLCEYLAGVPALQPDSIEAQENAAGVNLYMPMWLPTDRLDTIEFMPPVLQQALIKYLAEGFPESPASLMVPE